MNKQQIITGYLLLLAAGIFWISWFLMPDPGTTDTNHILKIVKESRTDVLNSVIMQVTASVLYVFVLLRLSQHSFPQRKITSIGAILFAIGVLGMCSDAFFHLLAYFMTADSVNIQQDVVRVMEFMQTTGVRFLIPLMLPFFIGNLVLAIGLKKQAMISGVAAVLFLIAFSVAITGVVVIRTTEYEVHGLSFTTLAIFAIAQAAIGMDLVKSAMEKKPLTVREPVYKYELLNNDFPRSN
jgi:hypothetical protein